MGKGRPCSRQGNGPDDQLLLSFRHTGIQWDKISTHLVVLYEHICLISCAYTCYTCYMILGFNNLKHRDKFLYNSGLLWKVQHSVT